MNCKAMCLSFLLMCSLPGTVHAAPGQPASTDARHQEALERLQKLTVPPAGGGTAESSPRIGETASMEFIDMPALSEAQTLSAPVTLSGTVNDPTALFTMTQKGTGKGLSVTINKSSSRKAAIFGTSNSAGGTVSSYNTGTGPAGYFEITNPASTNSALVVKTGGSGVALSVTHSKAADDTPAIQGIHAPDFDGYGVGVQGQGGYVGVQGYATTLGSYAGVVGSGPYGVVGSGDYTGVYGSALREDGVGVYGKGATGVVGESTEAEGAGLSGASSGGYGVVASSSSGHAAHFSGGADGGGTCYFAGGSGWSCTSDRAQKENFRPIDPKAVLRQLDGLTVAGWTMKGDSRQTPRIGPTAQDFHAAFGVGGDEKTINTADAQGVALAAIQGLSTLMREQQALIGQLRSELKAMQQQMAVLQNEQVRFSAQSPVPAAAAVRLLGNR
ncbi:tail fiber domain-containing protein [Gloeobacter violaceus]|uniref:Gll3483 protein n=1 Tax=Gloeobacter violaceus (strain ATCC 29082 / PCC 7421) TaxID=251221 RepID=Q7NFP1_GLOVI|nr:tail fiber domain-containing protein [Gloeobacter violaceus]BAC91424.1 gll3483 [Gloeobacter violaceus PCC 7421]